MPQSLARILIHYVFSTKNRERWIRDEHRDELHGYIGGIVEEHKGTLLCSASVEDHIHLLVAQPRTITVADLVEEIKTGSSRWIKTKSAQLSGFHWQSGYGAFSISPSHRPALEHYFAGQAEHHRRVTFQEEYRKLLAKYGIEYDERYVWD